MLRPSEPPVGVVDLINAHVGSLDDDKATWPTTLRLRGFVYDTLENERVSVRDRIGWVRRHQSG